MPTVSICIPVYNRAHELDRALSSVLAQTHRELDVVVVDNASTDDTFAVASRYAAQDPRVRVARNERLLDRVENWHRALRLARGEYVKLLFSDDWLSPAAVEDALRVLAARPDVGFVYSAMTWERDGAPHTYYGTPVDGEAGGDVPSVDFLYLSASIADVVPVTTSCTLFRRADLLDVFVPRIPARLPEDSHALGLGYEGILLWRCADRYPYVHHLHEALAHSADPQAGEPNTRTAHGGDRHEMLWWAYRNAFAHFVSSCRQTDAVKRGLVTTMFVSTVPLRPSGRRRLPYFRLLFDDFSPHRLRPLDPRVRRFLADRLRRPPDPIEILG